MLSQNLRELIIDDDIQALRQIAKGRSGIEQCQHLMHLSLMVSEYKYQDIVEEIVDSPLICKLPNLRTLKLGVILIGFHVRFQSVLENNPLLTLFFNYLHLSELNQVMGWCESINYFKMNRINIEKIQAFIHTPLAYNECQTLKMVNFLKETNSDLEIMNFPVLERAEIKVTVPRLKVSCRDFNTIDKFF